MSLLSFMHTSLRTGVTGLLLFAAVTGAPAAERAEDELKTLRDRFRAAWQAAGRGDHKRVLEGIAQLGDYVLVPYLQAEIMRQRVDEVPPAAMETFLARYRNWSFAGGLETAWLRDLGKKGDHERLLRHGGDNRDTRVRCYHASARVKLGRTDGLSAEIEDLWIVPRSQPDACDPVFEWWRQQGYPTAEQAWRRFAATMEAGQRGLAGYLRRYLDDSDRQWADRWLQLVQAPGHFRDARQWPDHPRGRHILIRVLDDLAAGDWERAEREWQALAPKFSWSAEQRGQIERRIALFRAVDLDPGAMDAIDALPAVRRDQQMLEWRVRAALAREDWTEVLAGLDAMPAGDRRGERWRYWRARALEALGRPDAALHYAALAGNATYFGFLAADRLGSDYGLCRVGIDARDSVQRRLRRDAEFHRAIELFHADLDAAARWTWRRVQRRISSEELRQAALLLSAEGWYDRAIFALGDAGARRAYTWRFPVIQRTTVEQHGRRHAVEPAWAYGLMRAESAMQPDAVSHANARGLLQLLPDTAAEVAQRHGLAYGGPGSLLDPGVNIPLGIAHLGELSRRFGNPAQVSAAYNAGVSAVERWLAERPRTATDIWLETLPYYETRDYVPRVMAFATVYDWLLNDRPRPLGGRLGLDDLPGDARTGILPCPGTQDGDGGPEQAEAE